MPEKRVAIDGVVQTSEVGPSGANFYVYALSDAPGTVAANAFVSIFNPVGSGKNLVFYRSVVLPYAADVTSVADSMDIFRITAASGGTLVAASAVPKFVTSQANTVAQVRTGNPTVTISGSTLLGTPPELTTSKSGSTGGTGSNIPTGAGFVCAPGEGLVAYTATGEVNQRWNIQFVWAEL